MNTTTLRRTSLLIALALILCSGTDRLRAQTATAPAAQPNAEAPKPEAVLKPADTTSLLPPSVFFRGQSAPLQIRNSGGIRFADGTYALMALVDSSGYSSSVREKYQAYILTEVPLEIGGHRLPPGAYGCGFITPDSFVVMDVGAHDLLTTPTKIDGGLRRPTPLQVVAGELPAHYRLYSGRVFVTFSRASQ
jgi:hypothetical protein